VNARDAAPEGDTSGRGLRSTGDSASLSQARPHITIEIPPQSEQPHVFRREFLGAIRKAIGDAQIRGDVGAELAIECCKALPPATPGKDTA
jgi:hypothetical protein